MREKVTIYGKDTCPYTTAAREDYAKKGYDVRYVNVKASPENMEEMLRVSKGSRLVPVIVEGGMVVEGFGGA
jgi:glutaredoxin 3